jgi:hypothetical protein
VRRQQRLRNPTATQAMLHYLHRIAQRHKVTDAHVNGFRTLLCRGHGTDDFPVVNPENSVVNFLNLANQTILSHVDCWFVDCQSQVACESAPVRMR